MAAVDVVIVSYNSRGELRRAAKELAGVPDVNVVVVDNASSDGSLDTIADLAVTRLSMPRNGGFAYGCNAGWRAANSPYVLFLNPDASIDPASLQRLVTSLEERPDTGIVAPRIEHSDGSLEFSLRRFPRLRSTFAQALFLQRLFPRAKWADEIIRDGPTYEFPGAAEWVSGACMLVRREVLELVGGLDDGFFMYCEDIDLCRRVRTAGYEVRFDPSATIVHRGGASAPRAGLLPRLAASRIRYARKHRSAAVATLERIGVGLGAFTHVLISTGGPAVRAGHARSLRLVLSRSGRT